MPAALRADARRAPAPRAAPPRPAAPNPTALPRPRARPGLCALLLVMAFAPRYVASSPASLPWQLLVSLLALALSWLGAWAMVAAPYSFPVFVAARTVQVGAARGAGRGGGGRWACAGAPPSPTAGARGEHRGPAAAVAHAGGQ